VKEQANSKKGKPSRQRGSAKSWRT